MRPVTHTWGAVALVASFCAYGFALGHIRALGQTRSDAWWFGYARDVSNLVTLGLVTLSFWGIGFPASLALAAAFLLVLFVYVLDYWLGRGLRRAVAGWLAAAVGVGIAALVLMAPARVVHELTVIMDKLFS
jgi:hypothetical protein